MTRRSLWLSLLGLAAFVVLVGWWLYTFEYVQREVDAPLHGEARYNPLYGLSKALRERGYRVDSRANLNLQAMTLGDEDTVLLGADIRTLSRDDVQQLLQWVERGGHLIFALPPAAEGRPGDLLASLHLAVIAAADCVHWQIDAKPTDPDNDKKNTAESAEKDAGKKPQESFSPHCFRTAFRMQTGATKQFDLLVEDDKHGYLFGRHPRGAGDWLVAGDLDFLHTDQLARPGNAELAAQILGQNLNRGITHLIYAADVPPLYVLLVQRGWPALVPLLLALLAWLWMRSQRLGPLLPLADPNRRALLDHIRAAGEFSFQRGGAAAMVASLRRLFLQRLRRIDPGMANLGDENLIAALVNQFHRPPDEIRQALNPIGLGQPDRFLATVKTLRALSARPSRSPHEH